MSKRAFEGMPNLVNKFYYESPLQVIAQAERFDGVRYLVCKQKPHTGSANFSWFQPMRFYCFVRGYDLAHFKSLDEQNNPYYWVEADKIEFTDLVIQSDENAGNKNILLKYEDE